MKIIKPGTQETILNILPDDYDTAMQIMCQLIGNMADTGSDPWKLERTLNEIKLNYLAYEGT